MVRTVGIITVGDELLAGSIVDRHGAWLSSRLTEAGFDVVCHVSVGDPAGELSATLSTLAPKAAAWIVTGGLGPTEDDRTRQELAALAGVDTEFRQESWDRIAEFYRRFGREPGENNRRQAFFPCGAEEILNPHGTAPAFRLFSHGSKIWALPGVPFELHRLFEESVLPALRQELTPLSSPALESYAYFGVSESVFDEWILSVLPPEAHRDYHVRATEGELHVRVPAGLELAEASRARFGGRFLGLGEENLSARVIAAALQSGATLATAESCTGGLLGSRLTSVPGSSEVYPGGWVTYANQAKVQWLGVAAGIISAHGAVSPECARAMATGARERAESDWAVSVTGIAGPGGGTPDKPVGTVHFGLASATDVYWKQLELRGDRSRIRLLAAQHALHGLLEALRESDMASWSNDQR